jgi:hypothetical protein
MAGTPHLRQVEELMRCDRIVAGGFFGNDARSLEEIVEADAATLKGLNCTPAMLAGRMKALRDVALSHLGNGTMAGETLELRAEDNRGTLICPFGDGTRHFKTVTHARRVDTGREIRWSDLNIHLIEAHGFFEGWGCAFRLEPAELVEMLLR